MKGLGLAFRITRAIQRKKAQASCCESMVSIARIVVMLLLCFNLEAAGAGNGGRGSEMAFVAALARD